MIVSLRGTLIEKSPTQVVIDAGGVGYGVTISLATYDRLPIQDNQVALHIYHHIREDSQQLFGFNTKKEREMFISLLTITGVGPKLAVNVLSGLTPGELASAIAEGDVKRISQVHGVGKKTAERIIVELKDKIDPLEALSLKASESDQPASPVLRDLALSLSALGYAKEVAFELAKTTYEAHPDATVQDLIRLALKK